MMLLFVDQCEVDLRTDSCILSAFIVVCGYTSDPANGVEGNCFYRDCYQGFFFDTKTCVFSIYKAVGAFIF
jgi:hypothetical protein